MKCERCNINNATHHYKKSVNGIVSEKFLCAACAAEENMPFQLFTSPTSFPLFTPYKAVDKTQKCSVCGTSFAEFNETAYLGCAECYTQMRNLIEPVIKKLHGTTQHIGKVPQTKRAEQSKAAERMRLTHALERAISEEAFEEAAKIRDQIRKIDMEGKQ